MCAKISKNGAKMARNLRENGVDFGRESRKNGEICARNFSEISPNSNLTDNPAKTRAKNGETQREIRAKNGETRAKSSRENPRQTRAKFSRENSRETRAQTSKNPRENPAKTSRQTPAKAAHFGTILRGKFKGARVAMPATAATRPTKSIVLGSLIDSLAGALRGGVFVEGFGGSGLLAANAASVGARAFAVECARAAFGVTAANAARFGFGAVFGDTFVETPRLLARVWAENHAQNAGENAGENGENFAQNPANSAQNFSPNAAQIHAKIPARNSPNSNLSSGAARNGENFAPNSAQIPANPAPKIILYLDPPFSIRAGFAGVYERCEALVKGSQDALDVVVFEHDSGVALSEKIGDFARVRARRFGRTTLSFYEKQKGEK